jgi:cation:H+ antiporter
MTGSTFQILAGFVLLIAGGEVLVRGAVAVARRLSVSNLVIGLVLVGFGTSTPELTTSINASLHGSPGIAVGNVVGSNIANTLLVLGMTAAITPILCDPSAFSRDAPMLALATALCITFAAGDGFGRPAGILFLLVLLGYTLHTYQMERRSRGASAQLHMHEAELAEPAPRSLWVGAGLTLLGVALVVAGAELMVRGAIDFARQFGVSETVIGLTLVAFGTSLPELATSIVAALRGRTDVALGNIIGSNLFNLLGILGATAVIAPMTAELSLSSYDLLALAGATVLLLAFAYTGRRYSRLEGLVSLGLYLAYMAFLGLRGARLL